jgi:hypothetical protein
MLVIDDVQSGGIKYFAFVGGIATYIVSVAPGEGPVVVQALDAF